ncbi:hypothetical protein [Rouxiella sp. Mn2063]|uniref:hypothetical protein n=1 Tax=Rouxiella sp. Mn2063 TaxID=3395262 RepID=UPI003BD93DC1
MPVLLDIIPEPAKPVDRPSHRRWLLFLVIIMLIGAMLTFWNWAAERSGFIFWFTALGLPFCTWGLFFSLRRFAYKVEQVGVQSWNVEREKLLESEIFRGQRSAWILGSSVLTKAGNGTARLLSLMEEATPLMIVVQPRSGGAPVQHAALPAFQENTSTALAGIISTVATYIQDIVTVLPDEVICWLMINCDNELSSMAEAAIYDELAEKTGKVYRRVSGSGMAAFDAWLDNRWDTPSIFIAVTISLRAEPKEGDTEAVTVFILSNRKADAYPDATRLHRPEKGITENLSRTLSRSLLWANRQPETLAGSWITGSVLTTGSQWNKACEDNAVTFSLTKDNKMIDPVLGYAGNASPWLAIALAESTIDEREAQIIAAQSSPDKGDIWVVVIAKENIHKE